MHLPLILHKKSRPLPDSWIALVPNTVHVRGHNASAAWGATGRKHHLATSPLTTAGSQNPVMDLLFSSRAAFIWDSTGRAVTWMNSAARTQFGLSPEALGRAIAPEVAEQFARCAEFAKSSHEHAIYIVKLKLGGARRPVNYSIDPLLLADGHDGLIVAEGGSVRATPGPVAKTQAPKSRCKPKASRRPKTPAKAPVPLPQLSPEELRSLKAIGRKVRKLCSKKQSAAPLPPAKREPDQPASAFSACSNPEANQSLLLAAFDLVLFLDADLAIVRADGRPQRLGWRKSSLGGKRLPGLLTAQEQTLFHRMVKRLNAATAFAPICHETLALNNELGGSAPCRVVLGRWEGGGAQYFFALLSLKVPRRLRRLEAGPIVPGHARLAA